MWGLQPPSPPFPLPMVSNMSVAIDFSSTIEPIIFMVFKISLQIVILGKIFMDRLMSTHSNICMYLPNFLG